MAIVVVLTRKERRLFVAAASGVSFNCVVFADGLLEGEQAARGRGIEIRWCGYRLELRGT